jgi:transcriptional regulator with XRE-family HTH domain
MSIAERLRQLLDDKELNLSDFERLTGYSHVRMSNILNGKTSVPKVDVFQMIIEHFPEVSLDWLIAGRGNMYLPAGIVMGEVPQEDLEKLPADTGAKAQEMIEIQRKLLETQEKLNELMERDNARLIQAMKEKDPEQAERLGF